MKIAERLKRFHGKRVGIIGMGVEAEALATFVASLGPNELIAFDRKDLPLKTPFTTIYTGDHYLDSLAKCDIVIRSPGVPFLLPEIQAAKAAGAEITSMTKLFFELCPAPIIGITGSNGKTTTTNLISHLLAVGTKKVWRGGNDAEPLINKLSEILPNDLVVLELSSFQLQDVTVSPHIAVITNITPNHLDAHKTLDEYAESKLNIIRFQKSDDIAILNAEDPIVGTMRSLGKTYLVGVFPGTREAVVTENNVAQRILTVTPSEVPFNTMLTNVAAAILIAMHYEIPKQQIAKQLRSFVLPPQRLEKVRTLDGVTYINDSSCTTPESAIVGLNAFPVGTVVLIAGGKNKGMSFTALGQEIVARAVKPILIGESAPFITEAIHAQNPQYPVHGATTLQEAIEKARVLAKSGDTILLSPACASFDMFKNAKDRGSQFTKLVVELK